MGKREKILIVLTAVAVLFLIVYKYLEPDKKNQPAQTHENYLSSADKLVEEQLEMQKKITQRDADKMIIKKALVNWYNDPFADPELMKQIEGKAKKEKITVETRTKGQIPVLYSGYIQAGKKMLAIINGMEYEKGDTIEGTNYKVFSASTGSIMLRSPDAVITTIHLIDELGPIARYEE
ncbi:MAG: hypothetical protein K8S18_09440 [Desulfobacula sp.]|nr:hypothetical protein [Desulfobacula sp.]